MLTILLALALTVRHAPVPVDRVELNHYGRDRENPYTQAILWRVMRMESERSFVANWRHLRPEDFSRSRAGGYHIIRYRCDGELIVIRARHFHESRTATDREYADRARLQECDRMPYLKGSE